MPPDYLRYAAIMLAAGIGIPVLAAFSAGLGARIASPAGSASIVFGVALAMSLAVLAVTAKPDLAAMAMAPKHLFLGGCFVGFYVLSVSWVGPRFGIGNAVMFVLLGQIISAAVIDQFGLFGARQIEVSLTRGIGILVMAVGVVLTQRG